MEVYIHVLVHKRTASGKNEGAKSTLGECLKCGQKQWQLTVMFRTCLGRGRYIKSTSSTFLDGSAILIATLTFGDEDITHSRAKPTPPSFLRTVYLLPLEILFCLCIIRQLLPEICVSVTSEMGLVGSEIRGVALLKLTFPLLTDCFHVIRNTNRPSNLRSLDFISYPNHV